MMASEELSELTDAQLLQHIIRVDAEWQRRKTLKLE